MKARMALAFGFGLAVAASATAQTIIVNEDFNGYADQDAFKQTWVPTAGNGNAVNADPGDNDAGYLIGCPTCSPITDPANYPGIQGQAIDHIGALATANPMVNQFGGLTPAFTINPSETESIFLKADIFVGNSGNERMTVGLRSRTPANLVEMGVYNDNTYDPRIEGDVPALPGAPNFLPSLGYGYRLVLFGGIGEDLIREPNWQYFNLPPELDRSTDADELVTIGDIGSGWHTYTATITPTTATFTIDLFRDNKRNTSVTPDENGDRPGTPGVDAEVTWEITTTPDGFNSLRIGGPSGLSSAGAGFMAFDNILLQLQAPAAPDDANFNGDATVDAADLTIWNNGFGSLGGPTSGDANNDGTVDGGDFLIWQQQHNAAAVPAAAGVPEPASAAMVVVALAALAAARRSRTS